MGIGRSRSGDDTALQHLSGARVSLCNPDDPMNLDATARRGS
jgi:hypothetical protein